MNVIILGCGTSTGVPVIGCRCSVCTSPHPRNKRTRASVLVRTGKAHILIDTSTDLRAQCLRHGLTRIDAVLFTHPHADHIHGIDELRAFNMLQKNAIPCYGSPFTIERIKSMFDYIFTENEYDGWKPRLDTRVISSPFTISDVEVVPVEIFHGHTTITGFRIGDMAYLTDCSGIPEASMKDLKDLKLLIIGALRHKPHPSHFSLSEALEASRRIGPERTVLTHLGHNLDYTVESDNLPPHVELAYDGMEIEL